MTFKHHPHGDVQIKTTYGDLFAHICSKPLEYPVDRMIGVYVDNIWHSALLTLKIVLILRQNSILALKHTTPFTLDVFKSTENKSALLRCISFLTPTGCSSYGKSVLSIYFAS